MARSQVTLRFPSYDISHLKKKKYRKDEVLRRMKFDLKVGGGRGEKRRNVDACWVEKKLEFTQEEFISVAESHQVLRLFIFLPSVRVAVET